MIDDAKLLVDYVANGSDEAFRQLVDRYLPLVYSAAVRRADGDVHLARDIAQRVFVDFARKAGRLSTDTPLSGWLHRHTCYVASTVLRTEHRRQAREREAIAMNTTEPAAESKWEETAFLLDDAIDRLGKEDRAAIVLRYLEQRDFNSVGRILGITEDAAQKRVTRALDKLRTLLGRRGASLSAAGLATALASQAVSAVPANLSLTISTAALAGKAAAGGLTLSSLKFMAMTKLKLGVGILVVAGAATSIILQERSNSRLRAEILDLHEQTQALEQLRQENQRLTTDAEELQTLRDERSELVRLRGQAAMLGQRERELAQALAELRRLRSATAAETSPPPSSPDKPTQTAALKPATEWSNLGIATPATAFETRNWAKATGDVDALSKTLVLDTEAKEKADTLFASLPEAVRQQYGSAERMVAMAQINAKPSATAAAISSQEALDTDNVILHMQWQYEDGQLGENDWRLHRDSEGWRFVVPGGLVDKLGKGLRLGGLTPLDSRKP